MADRRFYDAALLYRLLPLVWGGGSSLFLAVVLFGGVHADARAGFLLIDAAGWIVFATVALGRSRLPDWAFGLSQLVGIAIVTALVAVDGRPDSPLALFYLWLLVLAAYFDRWRQALAQGVCVTVAYGAVLAAVAKASFPFVQWLMLVTTVFAVGTLVALLRSRVAALLDRLHALAQTDELTGLGNRRGLLQTLEQTVASASHAQPVTVALFDLNRFKGYNDSFGHPAGDALLARLAARLEASVQGVGGAYRLGGDEFCAIVAGDARTRQDAIARAEAALAEHGEGFSISASTGLAEVPTEASTPTEALSVADRRLYRDKVLHQPARGHQLSLAADPTMADAWTAEIARRTGTRLGLAGEQLDVLARAVQLRDIGKIAIPEQLLRADEPLTSEQRDFLRSYVLIGERLLQATPPLRSVAEVVRSAEEHWDGSGYPDRLAGAEIALPARIVAVCSTLSAMASDCGRGPDNSIEEAIDELRAGAGSRFDPEVVEATCAVLLESPELADDRRSSGLPR